MVIWPTPLPPSPARRYQSFNNSEELAESVRAKLPAKIDIGPVYNVDPAARKSYSSFEAVERELVFDIDLTDYDDVLNFADLQEGAWAHCWPLMAGAVQVLDRALREDFGFKHLLWVFSGRRGIHCWVSDRRARQLTDEARRAVANYLQLWKGEEGGKIKVRLSDPLHPAAGRAGTVLHRVWEKEVLPRQQILENPKTMEKVLSHIPQDCGYLADELRESWSTGGGRGSSGGNLSVDRWQQFKRKLQKAADGASGPALKRALKLCPHQVVFGFIYPRLDDDVSKKRNHLLKAPFCVHPKTGKVCVPFDPAKAFEFDPDAVPTAASLLNELDAKGGSGWKDTSLADSVGLLERMLEGLAREHAQDFAELARVAANRPTVEF